MNQPINLQIEHMVFLEQHQHDKRLTHLFQQYFELDIDQAKHLVGVWHKSFEQEVGT